MCFLYVLHNGLATKLAFPVMVFVSSETSSKHSILLLDTISAPTQLLETYKSVYFKFTDFHVSLYSRTALLTGVNNFFTYTFDCLKPQEILIWKIYCTRFHVMAPGSTTEGARMRSRRVFMGSHPSSMARVITGVVFSSLMPRHIT